MNLLERIETPNDYQFVKNDFAQWSCVGVE
jgi:hypothetical protein